MLDRKEHSFANIYTPAKFHLDDLVLDELVQTGKLPRDILFRLQGVNEDDREAALEAAVLNAMRGHEPPSFVTAPYPDAVWVPFDHETRLSSHLSKVDADYHALPSYRKIAVSVDLQEWRAEQAWHRFVCEVRPELAEQMTAFAEDRRKGSGAKQLYRSALYWTVIKDEALLDVYEATKEREELRKVLGQKAVSALGYMLAQNHPELFDEVDSA